MSEFPKGLALSHFRRPVKKPPCINHIQKNFFPRTSLEGRPTWSKMVKIDQNRRGGGGSGIKVPQIYVAHYATAA